MNSIKIKNFIITENQRPMFVAEISGNHNQKLSNALKLIKRAKEAGADAVKFQYYNENDMSLNYKKKEFKIKDKKSPWRGKYLFDLYKKSSTPKKWFKKLFSYSKKMGILSFTSVFNHQDIIELEKLGNPAYKISSFEINHLPLIDRASKTGKPIIISTGIASNKNIVDAINICKKNKNNKIILLKCTSEYPAKLENSNLNSIPFYKKKYKCLVGLSDHTKGITASIVAAQKGACMIEKHLKLRTDKKSVDSSFSIDPTGLSQMIKICNQIKLVGGKKIFKDSKSVLKSKKFSRSIYTSKKIYKGEFANESNIRVIRSNKGIEPKYYFNLIGKKFRVSLSAAKPLKRKYLILK